MIYVQKAYLIRRRHSTASHVLVDDKGAIFERGIGWTYNKPDGHLIKLPGLIGHGANAWVRGYWESNWRDDAWAWVYERETPVSIKRKTTMNSIPKRWVEIPREDNLADLFLFVCVQSSWHCAAAVRYRAYCGSWYVEATDIIFDSMKLQAGMHQSHTEAQAFAETATNRALMKHGLPGLEC